MREGDGRMAARKASAKKKAPNGVAVKSVAGTVGTQKSAASSYKKRWTILLDIAADGVLANFGIESLKQLKNLACTAGSARDQAEVTVAAQFSVDAPAGQKTPRYILGPDTIGGSLSDCIADYLDVPRTMTEQQALIDFLQWAFRQKELDADYYALILWGHRPELLKQPPIRSGRFIASRKQSGGLIIVAVGSIIADRPPGGRRQSPASGSRKTQRADFPHWARQS
jgi:hypothetical protein